MNILQLCLSSGLGGLEIYVYRASQELSRNHRVVAVLHGKLLSHFRRHCDLPVSRCQVSFRPLPLLAAKRLATQIDEQAIDVIHMHWGKDLPLAVLAKVMSRKKPALVYTRQMKITRKKQDFYHRFLYSNVDLLLSITAQLAAQCREMIGDAIGQRIKTLYHGVEQPQYLLSDNDRQNQRHELGIDEDDFLVGLFGRLEEFKGQHLLIEAIAFAKSRAEKSMDTKIMALIVGHEMKAGYRDRLHSLAESLGVNDRIVFHDFVDEPQHFMQLCDCVALTTYEETFGLVLPEAMRCNVSVIGSNSGGVPEIIEHNKTGLLFEAGNAESLCEQILRLYADPELNRQLAAQGKQKADDTFNDNKHYLALEQYLKDAVTNKTAEVKQ